MKMNHMNLSVRFAARLAYEADMGEIPEHGIDSAVEAFVYAICCDETENAGYATDKIVVRVRQMVDSARLRINQTGRADRLALEEMWKAPWSYAV